MLEREQFCEWQIACIKCSLFKANPWRISRNSHESFAKPRCIAKFDSTDRALTQTIPGTASVNTSPNHSVSIVAGIISLARIFINFLCCPLTSRIGHRFIGPDNGNYFMKSKNTKFIHHKYIINSVHYENLIEHTADSLLKRRNSLEVLPTRWNLIL